MSSQLVQQIAFSQTYLSVILNLNILLVTASSLLLYKHKHDWGCAKILLICSIVISIVAIAFIVHSYQEVFEFILNYDPKILLNFKNSFNVLDLVFILNIISLVLTGFVLIISSGDDNHG